MDGDIARLKEIVDIKAHHGAALIIDEAHATGVLGKRGHGVLEAQSIDPSRVDAIMGTFSKAAGVFGAYVAGSRRLADWLRTRARGYIYTTAYPGAWAAAAMKALDLIEEGAELRRTLETRTKRFKAGLTQAGFDWSPSQTQILPIRVGDNAKALAFQRALEARGFLVSAIRPPTVPPGTARLRIVITAAHSNEDLDRLLDALVSEGRALEVIP